MESFAKALEAVAEVRRDGAATHPDNDWVRRGPEYHIGRAEEHLRLLRGRPAPGSSFARGDPVVDGADLARAGPLTGGGG
jgi:hypothetical protein